MGLYIRPGVRVAMATLILMIAVIVYLMYVSKDNMGLVPPTLKSLNDGLDSNYKFKNKRMRQLAEIIYDYKCTTEFNPSTDDFVSIFMVNNIISQPIKSTDLNDIALYKLATIDASNFSRLMYYEPIFNHPRYCECIKAYDTDAKSFKELEPGVNTRAFIITEILGIADATIDDLNTAIQKHLSDTNSSYNSSVAASIIQNTLLASTDEAVYNLLISGFINNATTEAKA